MIQKHPNTQKTAWMVDMEMRMETKNLRIKDLEAKVTMLTDMVDTFEDALNKIKKSRILGFFVRRVLKNAKNEKIKTKEK